MRARTLLLLATLATVGAVTGALAAVAPPVHVVRRDAAPEPAASVRPPSHALDVVDVLRTWDRRRARAWAAGDESALRALYLPGSRTGGRDVAMLAAYRSRGLRVTTMQRQVLAVRVRSRSARTLWLVVTDRLALARVTGRTRAALPRSRPSVHRIVFRRTGGRWRVAEVYDDRARPAASTAATSGSRNS
jgi:hypothetical protein